MAHHEKTTVMNKNMSGVSLSLDKRTIFSGTTQEELIIDYLFKELEFGMTDPCVCIWS